MKRYGVRLNARQWRRVRLVRSLLRDWGANLNVMDYRCVVRRVITGLAGGSVK
jgi:hypothetical protein